MQRVTTINQFEYKIKHNRLLQIILMTISALYVHDQIVDYTSNHKLVKNVKVIETIGERK